MDSDQTTAVYNTELMNYIARVKDNVRLLNPNTTAEAYSPVCGSTVTIDLNVKDHVITDIGYDVSACALTKTVLAVLVEQARGMNVSDIQSGAGALNALLENGTPAPAPWQDLNILMPARNYTARHNSMILPFRAMLDAFHKLDKTA